MKKRYGEIIKYSVVLTFGVLIAFVMGCGGGGGGGSAAAPTTSSSSGTLSTSATGTTAAVVTTVTSPAGSTISLQPSTTLTNASGQPVTGAITTSVTYATSPNNLPAKSVTPIMPDVAVFLDIDMGAVKNISPPMTAKMAVPGIAAGTLIDIYSFDEPVWVLESPDVPVASDGTVTASIGHLSIWAACKKNTLNISGTPQTSAVVGTAYSFLPHLVASKRSSLIFSITNKPAWASFSTTTGALTGTPATANIGTTSGIVISVTDGTLTKSLPAFNLTVAITGGSSGTVF